MLVCRKRVSMKEVHELKEVAAGLIMKMVEYPLILT